MSGVHVVIRSVDDLAGRTMPFLPRFNVSCHAGMARRALLASFGLVALVLLITAHFVAVRPGLGGRDSQILVSKNEVPIGPSSFLVRPHAGHGTNEEGLTFVAMECDELEDQDSFGESFWHFNAVLSAILPPLQELSSDSSLHGPQPRPSLSLGVLSRRF